MWLSVRILSFKSVSWGLTIEEGRKNGNDGIPNAARTIPTATTWTREKPIKLVN